MVRFSLIVRNHGFSASYMYEQDKRIITEFNKSLEVFSTRYNPKTKQVKREYKFTYATHIPKVSHFGFHIGLMNEFLEHLKRHKVDRSEIDIKILEPPVGAKITIELNPNMAPRENQLPIIDFVCEYSKTRILPIQTGFGKSALTLFSVARMARRTALIMGAMHIDTWKRDAAKFYLNSTQELLIIQGRDAFRKTIVAAKENTLKSSIIIFSVNTFRDYLTEYETMGKTTYGCLPIDLYSVLRIENVVIDECHQNLHFVFRHAIETNVAKHIYLSATLESNDAFTNRMYRLIFPVGNRYAGLEWDKYIAVCAIGYRLHDPTTLRCMGDQGYSHVMYEQWIMKDKKRLANYLNMIYSIISKTYLANYIKGQKALIFISTVELCDIAAAYIADRLDDPNIKVHAYTSAHEDEILHTTDIITSTHIKSGTGKDIAGLVTVLSTIAIAARERNLQMIGRLRKLDTQFPGVVPTFYYLTCLDIPKQMDYHKDKIEIMQPKVKSINVYRSDYKI